MEDLFIELRRVFNPTVGVHAGLRKIPLNLGRGRVDCPSTHRLWIVLASASYKATFIDGLRGLVDWLKTS